MITRSLSRLRLGGGVRRSPERGRGTRASFSRTRGAGRLGPMRGIGNKRRGMTVANNYWSSTSNDPNNAWNVNFNNGNANNDNKNNNNYVRAVRTGS